MESNLDFIKTEVYDKCGLQISTVREEAESKEYHACRFELNGAKIVSRMAKITPKKVGQFVTFWKRNQHGITEPLNESDPIDFYVVTVKTDKRLGQFVFPKSILISKGILSTTKKEGKRGFRVYPAWDETQNKQAIKTQKWQLNYFFEINAATDFKKVTASYEGN